MSTSAASPGLSEAARGNKVRLTETPLKTVLVVLLLLLVGAFVALVILKNRGRRGAPDASWPFYARRPLSQPEQVLYHRLIQALPEHIVLAQVQVSRVLGVKKGFNFHEWNNRINRLSYDFVVCTKDAMVLAVIELDDKSHEAESRADADRKKDSATAAAGLRLVRWQVKALPDEATIRAEFAAAPRRGADDAPDARRKLPAPEGQR